MAQRTILVDDLTGSEGEVDTVPFSLDGKEYEIDLSHDNQARLLAALKPYIDKARRTGVVKKSGKSSRDDLPAIREWGQANGWEVAERGRVPKDLIAAYDARYSRAA